MKKILFFSLVFISLIQFGTTAWSLGLKLPELPGVEAKINFSEDGISLTPDFSLPKPFPNLAEAGEDQLSSGYWLTPLEIRPIRNTFLMGSTDLYPKATMKNKTWDKVRGTWRGSVAEVISKVTGKSNNNVFVWTVIHSFFDSVTDAKAHSRGKTKYFSGDADWHIWKNCRDVSAVMITLNFGRRIFIEKITVKEAARDLLCVGLIRLVVHNTTMKIIKGGFSAYNDPHYNQHTLPYWGFKDGKLTDKYIATGRVSTWVVDGSAIAGFWFLKKWEF